MKRIGLLVLMAAVFVCGIVLATTTTVDVAKFTYTITNKSSGVKIVYNQIKYTNWVSVTCLSGQVYVDPTRYLDWCEVANVRTSRNERTYLTPTNTLKMVYYPNTFRVGNTNTALNTYYIQFE